MIYPLSLAGEIASGLLEPLFGMLDAALYRRPLSFRAAERAAQLTAARLLGKDRHGTDKPSAS